MKWGATFPQTEIGLDPNDIRSFALALEAMGCDYLLAYDHVLGANPDRLGGLPGIYTYRNTFHEPFTLFSYLAALTQRLEFVTGVLILPQRQTALVAKQAAQLSLLSGGRLRLGVGVGWNPVEFTGMGADFSRRGRLIEEQVPLLRALWAQPLVSFTGEYHTLPDVGLNPLPPHPIPVWFGGGADAVLRRMARLGDGWIPSVMPPDRMRAEIEKLRGYLAEAGRDLAAFGIDAHINMKQTPESHWRREADALRALSVTHICLSTMGVGFTHVEQHIEAMRRFQRALS